MAKKCWSCGKDTMVTCDFGDGRRGEKCTNCGATDTSLPKHLSNPGFGRGGPALKGQKGGRWKPRGSIR